MNGEGQQQPQNSETPPRMPRSSRASPESQQHPQNFVTPQEHWTLSITPMNPQILMNIPGHTSEPQPHSQDPWGKMVKTMV